jgi:hypothetical protein
MKWKSCYRKIDNGRMYDEKVSEAASRRSSQHKFSRSRQNDGDQNHVEAQGKHNRKTKEPIIPGHEGA